MPIHLAALRGQVDVIALLCDHGASLSALDADGAAPLHKALGQGHVVDHSRRRRQPGFGGAEALRCRLMATWFIGLALSAIVW